jgi:hypothetical protein
MQRCARLIALTGKPIKVLGFVHAEMRKECPHMGAMRFCMHALVGQRCTKYTRKLGNLHHARMLRLARVAWDDYAIYHKIISGHMQAVRIYFCNRPVSAWYLYNAVVYGHIKTVWYASSALYDFGEWARSLILLDAKTCDSTAVAHFFRHLQI